MSATSILSDDLLRQLMAVGQVDVLVGIPTFNNATTILDVVWAVHVALEKYFPRERTLLLNTDAGSSDDTPARAAAIPTGKQDHFVSSQVLRTRHRISALPHGPPGKGRALRTIFAAGDLLGAKAIAVFDPDVTSITPEWLPRLVRPVLREGYDFVSRRYARGCFEGPLVAQLVRPLLSATFGKRLKEPIGGELGCSGHFASQCAEMRMLDTDFPRYGVDAVVAGTALGGDYRVCEAFLGPHKVEASGQPIGLSDVFTEVVGAVFNLLELHQGLWLARQNTEQVPIFGEEERPAEVSSGAPDPAGMLDSFKKGVRDLSPVLSQILAPETLENIRRSAEHGGGFPDPLWANTVYEFAAGYHRGVMSRDHLAQALLPIYLGRTACFVRENSGLDPPAVEARLDALCGTYEESKKYLVSLWAAARKVERP